ncbi:hypothetical protein HanIR_Chr14g0673661 [Helianthus annuus]|nr:hypothetical protein HanIR_Chr14g0673661 [Helianthus annuus]
MWLAKSTGSGTTKPSTYDALGRVRERGRVRVRERETTKLKNSRSGDGTGTGIKTYKKINIY